MKKLLALFALLATVPLASLAQTPAPGAPPMPQRDRGMMRQDMQQMMSMHKQLRANLLAAITPAHRNLLASLVGQLAISSNPDPRGAIAKLDAALSSGEKQSIVNAVQSFHSKMRAMHQAEMARMRAANPNMPSPRPMPTGMERMRRAPDPGELLFMMATAGSERGMMGMMGRHMGGPVFGGPGGFMRRPLPSPTP